MGALQLGLDVVLIGLLGASLFYAVLMERARGAIKQDRAELERLIQGFDDSNRQAEAGAERLRMAADAAGRAMTRQIEGASNLKDELADLIERGERLSSRLGGAARNEEPAPLYAQTESEPANALSPRVRSQAERDLLRALRVNR